MLISMPQAMFLITGFFQAIAFSSKCERPPCQVALLAGVSTMRPRSRFSPGASGLNCPTIDVLRLLRAGQGLKSGFDALTRLGRKLDRLDSISIWRPIADADKGHHAHAEMR